MVSPLVLCRIVFIAGLEAQVLVTQLVDGQLQPTQPEADAMELLPSIELWKVPGHTPEDIAVIVRNANGLGTVAIAGDVFYTSAEGLADTPIWTQTALDAVGGKLSQQKVLCNVGYIMPGHGAIVSLVEHHAASTVKCADCLRMMDMCCQHAHEYRQFHGAPFPLSFGCERPHASPITVECELANVVRRPRNKVRFVLRKSTSFEGDNAAVSLCNLALMQSDCQYLLWQRLKPYRVKSPQRKALSSCATM